MRKLAWFIALTIPGWASSYGNLGGFLLGFLVLGMTGPSLLTAVFCSNCVGRGREGWGPFLFSWIAGTALAIGGVFLMPALLGFFLQSVPVAAAYSSLVTFICFHLHPRRSLETDES